MNFNKLLIVAGVALSLSASSQNVKREKTAQQIDPIAANIDPTVSAATDFFYHANGSWFKAHPIPASENSNGIFRTIQDTINSQIKHVCEEAAAANAKKGSNKQKVGDFYASGMDTAAIEKAGFTALNELFFKRIKTITDTKSLMLEIAKLQTMSVGPAFGFYVGQDDKLSMKYALFLYQGGLGLGDRDYYFNTDSRTVNIRTEYVKHIAKMFELTGMDASASKKTADDIMKLETDLAKNSRKLEALRDPQENYNKMSMQELNQLTPAISWPEMMAAMGIKNADTLIIGQPEFFTGLNDLTKNYSIDVWKMYLKWNVLNTYAAYLNSAIDKQNFYFYSTVMSGVEEQKPRWKRVVETTDDNLGELIGQVYVDEYLPKGTKEKLMEIGHNISDVYAERIKNLTWMSEQTKVKALNKLSKIVMKVGYPDKWKDMSSVIIDRGSYVKNIMSVNEWRWNYMINKFGKPVDRNEWNMYPQTYNAYYNPSNNEIVVPACNIIVPGFEGRMPDDAVLYGIIGGSTFGHEITHGFDDQGSQYDENGNLNNWWTEEDRKKFETKTKLIVEQFSNYTLLDSMHVNGDATQGENIADLGGVVMGYEALKKTKQFTENQKIAGLSPDQRYFLAYGYAWMVNRRPAALARQIMTDVHSPSQFRVNGPVSNIPEFYKAFNIKEGDAMWRADSVRVVIW